MSKYNWTYGSSELRDCLLESIANELAEANRLKRLELRVLCEIKYDMPKTAQEASEDRA